MSADEIFGSPQHEIDALAHQFTRAKEIIAAQREALNYFLGDSRFQISVGGNPHAVEAMLAKARAALALALDEPKP